MRGAWLALAVLTACTGNISQSGHRVGRNGVGAGDGSAANGAFSGAAGAAGVGSGAGAGGGFVPGAGTSGAAGTSAGVDSNGNALTCTTKAVGPSPLRRLTHTEYDNAVLELLGDGSHPALAFAKDTEVGIFDNTASAQTIPELLADQYLESAATLAENISNVGSLVGCDLAGDATCARGFIERFGRRVYRRPLSADEVTGLLAVYTDTMAESDAETGARGVVAAMLASPNFLFRPEEGGADSDVPGAKQATAFELASRLASLLWASTPDDALLEAAAGGQLQTREQVATQARRMLDDDKAHAALSAFYEQWLGLPLLASATKDTAVYPEWSEGLRAAMAEETKRFIDDVLWQGDAKLSTLLTAGYSFVNPALAAVYGVSAPAGDAFAKTTLDAAQRAGVLTQPSLMTVFAGPSGSSPIKRGKLVRVRLLCHDLPDPPANVPAPPPPQEGVSTRERFAMHTDNDACRGCHHLIDGLGFGLEHYDGIGKYRDTDHGVAVDASGEVNETADIDGEYSGGPELAMLLSGSSQVRDCVPTQWLRYALARRESDDDDCSLVGLRAAFATSGGDLRELMVAITQTDAFMSYRQPE